MSSASQPKFVRWIGSAQEDLRALPDDVKDVFGYAIYLAQCGGKHDAAKPMKGFGGAGVLEVVDDFDGDTYRAVYTVKFAGIVYVLHAFQKKSKHGNATDQTDVDLIQARLKRAAEDYKKTLGAPKQKSVVKKGKRSKRK